MKYIIELPEEVKQKIDENLNACDLDIYDCVMLATKNGTPLPKDHGRLIDADVLCDYFWDNRSKLYTHKDLRIVIDMQPTIIEADKEYEAKVITRGNCMMCGKELTEGLFFCKECENKANSEKENKE